MFVDAFNDDDDEPECKISGRFACDAFTSHAAPKLMA